MIINWVYRHMAREQYADELSQVSLINQSVADIDYSIMWVIAD